MLHEKPFLYRMIVAIAFALVLANVIIILNLYITNYLQSDGYRIANGMIAGGDFVTFYQAGALIKDEPGSFMTLIIIYLSSKSFINCMELKEAR